MILSKNRRNHLALTALAVVLPVGLTACNQQQPADKTGQNIVQPADQTAQKQIDQAQATLTEQATSAGKSMDDTVLATRVKAALIAEPSIKATAIDVDSRDGVITLFGTVDNLASRDKASQTAAGVQGVKTVLNNVKIISGS